MPALLRLASGALAAIGSLAALRTTAAVPARATTGDIEVALSDVEKGLTALKDTPVAFEGTWSGLMVSIWLYPFEIRPIQHSMAGYP